MCLQRCGHVQVRPPVSHDVISANMLSLVQRARYADLRAKLTDACIAAGMTPPLPADFATPLSTSL